MIEHVTVRDFRSIEDLALDLGQVNVLIGANGSGKSNLLEAIGVIGAAAAGRVDHPALLRRGVRPARAEVFTSSFRRAPNAEKWPKPRLEVAFAASGGGATYEVGLWGEWGASDPRWRFRRELLREGDIELANREPQRAQTKNPTAGLVALKSVEINPAGRAGRLLRALQEYAIFTPQTPVLRGLSPDPQQLDPLGLSGGRLADAVQELFRKRRAPYLRSVQEDIVELIDWAQNFRVSPVNKSTLAGSVPSTANVIEFTDRFMAIGRNRLTAYDVSEGALVVFLAAVLCVHPRAPRTFAIDNADHGLNPRLARALVARMCRWALENPEPRQVLITTHNPLVLDGLPLQDERVRLFAVERTLSGRTIATRIKVTPEMLKMAAKGQTLSQMWVTGYLGGVPNV
jgi:energy-coupling factor transporter ATP-binding protein EcfA2